MLRAYNAIDNTAEVRASLIDLKKFSENELVRELERILDAWSANDYHLHLFFDSLDEARVRISTVTHIIIRRLERFSHSVSRLSFRIACRMADFPASFEEDLKRVWVGEGVVKSYVLAPLQQQDVVAAARANNIEDPHRFLREILDREVGSLASIPITLDLLLRSYHADQPLSGNRVQLYHTGCLALCREYDETYQQHAGLQPEQRMAVAARIAACTLLANKYGIALEQAARNTGSESEFLVLEDLSGGYEVVDNQTFPVWRSDIMETLRTGLFSGDKYRIWVHQTFAEFLAARYIKDMTLRQIRELIFHSDGKLIPQLQEAAGWIALMRNDVFEEILTVQPDILLRSDIAGRNMDTKIKLAQGILAQIESAGWPRDLKAFMWFARLNHPGLESVVRPYIETRGKPFDVRVAAILMAEECRLDTLQDLLVEIALDGSEVPGVKEYAAAALVRIGSDETKRKLKPLAMIPLDEIVDRSTDQLKRHSLDAVWPKYLTAAELFSSLSTTLRDDDISRGNYLVDLVPRHLNMNDMPIALQWVETQPRRFDLAFAIPSLMDEIMLRAWEFLDDRNVLTAFVRAALSRLIRHDPVVGERMAARWDRSREFRGMLLENDGKRRMILTESMPYLVTNQDLEYEIFAAGMVVERDVYWLLERCAEAQIQEIRDVLARLIQYVLRWFPDTFEVIYDACQSAPALEEAMGHPFRAIRIDSPLGIGSRQRKQQRKALEREMADRQNHVLDPSPRERALVHLESCEEGNPDAWSCVAYWMLFQPNGSSPISEYQMDVTVYPVWQELDAVTQQRIVNTARAYLDSYDPGNHDWLRSESASSGPVTAGYKAFRLLWTQSPNLLDTMDASVWRKWSEVLLFYLPRSGSPQIDIDSPDQELIQRAYVQAPEAVLQALMRFIDLESGRGSFGSFSIANWTSVFWDDRLAERLLIKAQDENLQPRCIATLLHQLLAHHVSQAEDYARSLILLPIPEEGRLRELAVMATTALLQNTVETHWDTIWRALESDSRFGRDVVANIVSPDRHYFGQTIGRKLTEVQLALFYAWLVRQYPPNQDPSLSVAATERYQVAGLRDAIRDELVNRGTKTAVIELQRLTRELPELDLRFFIQLAQEQYHRQAWTPPTTTHILALARDRMKGLVESGSHLLELIIESLERLQERMKGQYPAVFDLWNEVTWSQVRRVAETLPEVPDANFGGESRAIANTWQDANWRSIQGRKLYWPKDELSLSDYIARYLRELEIRAIAECVNDFETLKSTI